MRKTLLITLDYWPHTGGVANYWSSLNKYLPPQFFSILTIPFPDKNFVNEKNVIRKKILFDYFWPRWSKLIFIILSLKKVSNFSIFIAGQILPIGTVLWFLKKIGLIKIYYVSCHGYDVMHLQRRKKHLAKLILKSADKIIVNSNFTRQLINDFSINNEKIILIYPGPQEALINLAKPIIRNKKTDSFNIITVARLVARKGIDKVIRSLPQVDKKLSVQYNIVGTGPEENNLKKLSQQVTRQLKQSSINFIGKVDNEKLADLYRQQDLFIMLPQNLNGDIEGFGMVYLEAGLFCLPVIATASGGVSEAVKDKITGVLLSEYAKIDEVAEQIITLLSNQQLLDLYGKNNYQWAKTFNWSGQAQLLINLMV